MGHRVITPAKPQAAIYSPPMSNPTLLTPASSTPKWFVRGDIDGFFGLFVDNLLQLLLVLILCPLVCGLPPEFVVGTILPGAAISIAAGNFFYAWQARRLARNEGRNDVTALPFGIN